LLYSSNDVNNISIAPCMMRFTLTGATVTPAPNVKVSFRY
jgi:hypothetical protein